MVSHKRRRLSEKSFVFFIQYPSPSLARPLRRLRERSLTIGGRGGGGAVNFGEGLCFFGCPFGVGHNFLGPRLGEDYNFF